jgi:hypothetical protein
VICKTFKERIRSFVNKENVFAFVRLNTLIDVNLSFFVPSFGLVSAFISFFFFLIPMFAILIPDLSDLVIINNNDMRFSRISTGIKYARTSYKVERSP